MEERRVCAFIDALGTKEIITSQNANDREDLIKLIRRLSQLTSDYSPNAESYGFAMMSYPSAQTTTFSDNVAISFPLTSYQLPVNIGGENRQFSYDARQFLEHLFIQVTVSTWDALKLGILFRGGITIGNLIHDKEIVVGEALVTAATLEKATRFPRIEVSSEVMEAKIEGGEPLMTKDFIEDCIYESDGRFFVNTLGLHIGYWRDHNYFRQQAGLDPENIPTALANIRKTLDHKFVQVVAEGNKENIIKWEWFFSDLQRAMSSGHWHRVEGALEAACPQE